MSAIWKCWMVVAALQVGAAEVVSCQQLPYWTIDERPVVRLADDGSPHKQFGGAVGAVSMPSGELVVADLRARELRVFGPDGSYLRMLGRGGQGPGELGSRFALHRVGDVLFVVHSPPDPTLVVVSGIA